MRPSPAKIFWFALFLFGFTAYFWAGPIVRLYKLYYISLCPSFLLTGLLALQGKLYWGQLVNRGLPLFLFFSYLTASAWWAEYPETTLWWIAVDSIYPVIFVVAYALALNLDLKSLFWVCGCLPYVVLLFTVYSLARFGVLRPEFYGEAPDLEGGISNFISGYLAAALPLVLWRNYVKPGLYPKLVIAGSLVLILVWQSRAAYMTGALTLVLALFDLEDRKGRALTKLLWVCGGVALVFFALMMLEKPREYVGRVLERLEEQTTFSYLDAEAELGLPYEETVDLERRLMWLTAHRCFVSRPLLGVGYMNIGPCVEATYGWDTPSHGLVTTLLGETGLVGTALFLWMMTAYFVRVASAIRACRDAAEARFHKACRCCMVSLLAFGLFHQVQQVQLFYVMLAFGYAALDRVALLNWLGRAASLERTAGPAQPQGLPGRNGHRPVALPS